MRLILASGSPRRKELLENLGLEFQVIPSLCEEKIVDTDPVIIASSLAKQKAEDVAGRVKEGLVLGADTIVYLDGTILGKPRSKKEAVYMLNLLKGKEHQVITGVAVIDALAKKSMVDYEVTKVFFRDLTEKEVKNYVEKGESFDKAGAYGVQGLGSLLVQRIEGCYFNVVGLPLTKVYLLLQRFGVEIL
jgi:septum formation protein